MYETPANGGINSTVRAVVARTGDWLLKLLCLLLVLPVIALIGESLSDVSLWSSTAQTDSAFSDIAQSVLSTYVKNSVLVVIGTLVCASLFAIAPAWWCARYEFKGRRILQWAMLFPLAIPAYINAYIYTEFLDYSGPIQSFIRHQWGIDNLHHYTVFDIRSLWGACWVLGLSLYPYLFLLMRNAFAKQSNHLSDAAKMLGVSGNALFWRVHLPLARPALAVGCTLVAMETLADYGTMNLFAISTLTTAIYDSWLVHASLPTAAKLSCMLLLFIVLVIGLEQYSRRQAKHYDSGSSQPLRQQATRPQHVLILLVCMGILMLGFMLPVITLVDYAITYASKHQWAPLIEHGKSTFLLASWAAIVTAVIAIILNVQRRFSNKRSHTIQQGMVSLGYAIPGTILAIGILIPLGVADRWLNDFTQWSSGQVVGLVFSGSMFALVAAFVIRFAALANGSLKAAYQNVPDNLDAAARSLGASHRRLLWRIHAPLMTPALTTALLLVFVECVKELPASLLLRPFDLETLATYTYQYVADEQLELVSMAALFIIAVSLIPILILIRTQQRHT